MDEYKVVYEIVDAESTIKANATMTQSSLASLLQQDGIRLVSVNDSGVTYRRKKKRNK